MQSSVFSNSSLLLGGSLAINTWRRNTPDWTSHRFWTSRKLESSGEHQPASKYFCNAEQSDMRVYLRGRIGSSSPRRLHNEFWFVGGFKQSVFGKKAMTLYPPLPPIFCENALEIIPGKEMLIKSYSWMGPTRYEYILSFHFT